MAILKEKVVVKIVTQYGKICALPTIFEQGNDTWLSKILWDAALCCKEPMSLWGAALCRKDFISTLENGKQPCAASTLCLEYKRINLLGLRYAWEGANSSFLRNYKNNGSVAKGCRTRQKRSSTITPDLISNYSKWIGRVSAMLSMIRSNSPNVTQIL